MKKYSKKIALILVLALTLAVAVPALAATTTKITGQYEEPTIEVRIPSAGEAVINPYGLPVKVKADTGVATDYRVGEDCQVATRPLVGVNLSTDLPLKIGATVTGEERGDFTLLTTKPAATSKEKEGLVYFEIDNPTDSLNFTGGRSGSTVCGGFDIETVCNALNTHSWPAAYSASSNQQILVGEEAISKSNMVKLAVSKEESGVVTPQVGSYFMARLAGEVVQIPTEEWKTYDGFNVTISWIIEPDKAASGGT